MYNCIIVTGYIMKANELRIGNLLRPDKNHLAAYGNNPAFVTAIYDDKFIVCNHYPGKWFETIPLTEEWLLKFGFEYFGRMTGWVIGNHSINEFGDFFEFCINKEIPVKLQYVHQLQNLYFALTGEELTIK